MTTERLAASLLSRSQKIKEPRLHEAMDLKQWRLLYDGIATDDSIALAATCAVECSAFAFAFLSGYQAALYRMLGARYRYRLTAFCVSEKGGNSARQIQSQLQNQGDKWLLNGNKSFITCADEAELLLVAASAGELEGRKDIRLACIASTAAGVRIENKDGPGIVPEIKHGKGSFNAVAVADSDLLPGDAYECYVKPFRTFEDLHVGAAALAYVFRLLSLHNTGSELQASALMLLEAAQDQNRYELSEPVAHVVLDAWLHECVTLIQAATEQLMPCDAGLAQALRRDSVLLGVASNARQRRLEKAWKQLV